METIAFLFLKKLEKLSEYEREVLIKSVKLENTPFFIVDEKNVTTE